MTRSSDDQTASTRRSERVRRAAIRMLRSEDRAEKWLQEPNFRLGGKKPTEVAETDEGAEEVIALIMRIQHGVY